MVASMTAVAIASARPVLKWAGGKTSLLPAILPRLPAQMDRYYEPFMGGGAVFFALASERRFKQAFLGDANAELMLTYQTLARKPEAVIAELEKLAAEHSEKFFYAVRARKLATREHGVDAVAVAARLLYLNKTCFNGLYRVNKKGEFNVPFGDYKNPTICDEDALRAAARVLAPADMGVADFEECVQSARRGDAVYFDPPYVPASDTANFTAYSKGGFGLNEHERLRDTAEKLIARGVHVLLSNSDTPLVRYLYEGFKLEPVKARRAINSKGDKRGHVVELLISAKGKW